MINLSTEDFYFKYLRECCGLNPDWNVLDVGCGEGRMVGPFIDFLKGRYCGFDVIPSKINECKDKVKNNPNFDFKHVDVKSDRYNLGGKLSSNTFVFPYEDNTFDLVFLMSVFTHMERDGILNYLFQINRVLKNNGICLATFFIIDRVSLGFMNMGFSFYVFKGGDQGIYYLDGKKAIAYGEGVIREAYYRKGFIVKEPFIQGGWRIGSQGVCFQDCIVASKD